MIAQGLNPTARFMIQLLTNRSRTAPIEDDPGQITLRNQDPNQRNALQPISAEEIRALRMKANLSQSAFARLLNLTTGYVSKLERGVKIPSGPALALLHVIRRKGLEAIL